MRNRPGLVQHDRVDLLGGLKRLGRADEDAVFSALAGADHDRQRGRKPEGARAGDDQHGYRADERECERWRRTGHEPDHESCDRDAHNHWNEIARDFISESLDRRFRTLGLFDEPADLSEHRILADSGGPEPEGAGLVDGCPDHGVTYLLGFRYRFTGDHRLIDS